MLVAPALSLSPSDLFLMLGVLGAALSLQPASQPVLRLVVLVIQAHLRRLRRHPRHILTGDTFK